MAHQAADHIEQLTARNMKLRKVLLEIVDDCEAEYPPSHGAIKYYIHTVLKEDNND